MDRETANGFGASDCEGRDLSPRSREETQLTVAEVESWLEKDLAGMEDQLRSRPRDDEALKDEEIKRLKQKVGELVLDNDIPQEAAKPYRPTEGRTSDE